MPVTVAAAQTAATDAAALPMLPPQLLLFLPTLLLLLQLSQHRGQHRRRSQPSHVLILQRGALLQR